MRNWKKNINQRNYFNIVPFLRKNLEIIIIYVQAYITYKNLKLLKKETRNPRAVSNLKN